MPSAATAMVSLFFLSGAAALVVETTWLRWFELLFGATAPAASATLVAFFAGQAAGARWGGRRLPRIARPLAAYGGLELVAAAWGLAVPACIEAGEWVMGGAYDPLRAAPAALTALRFAIALAATLPAALCLGATFPAMGAALLSDARDLGTGGSTLYAANLLGGAVGAALAAFWLPDWIGVHATYVAALALQAAVGAAALGLDRKRKDGDASREPAATTPGPERGPSAPGAPSGGWLAGLAALSGFGSFAAQVLFVHAYAQILNQSVYAFGAVLVTVLATLAIGAAAVAAVERTRRVDPRTLLGASLVAAALALPVFPALLFAGSDGLHYAGASEAWPGYLGRALALTAGSAGLPLLALALVFPSVLAVAGHREAQRPVAAHLGHLLAANTVGAIAGALVAPFGLLPAVGLWPAFLALAVLYGIFAVFTPAPRRSLRIARDGLLALGWIAVLVRANPLGLPLAVLHSGEQLLFGSASAAGVVAVVARGGERLIRTDHHYNLGGTAERVHQERQGHLPLLLHAEARRVAYLGTATAISAGAATLHPVSQIALVEIVPGVSEAARRFFHGANRGIYNDPRTRVVLDDARNFIRATGLRFDVIVADLFVPWRAGVSALYAREHFVAVRERLAHGGLFCQWLPLYQLTEEELRIVAATFLDAFPRAAIFRGDFYGRYPIAALVGYQGSAAPAASVSAAAERLGATGETDRWVTDPAGPWSLYVGPLSALAPALRGAPRNSDDRPRIAYLAARSHRGGQEGVVEPAVGLRWVRFVEPLVQTAGGPEDAVYADLPEVTRSAARGGAWLQAAGALFVAGRHDEAGRALAAASERLPRRLLADAPADPTAADVWRDEE